MQIPDKVIYQKLINYLANTDSLSIANQQAYVLSIQEFFSWLSKNYIDLFSLPQKKFLAKLNKTFLDDFRSLLRNNNISPAIIERKIAHVKYFFKWAKQTNIYQKNPFLKTESFGTYLGGEIGVMKIKSNNKQEVILQHIKKIAMGAVGLLIIFGIGILKPWVWWQAINDQIDHPVQSNGQFDRRLIIDQNWAEGQKNNIAQAKSVITPQIESTNQLPAKTSIINKKPVVTEKITTTKNVNQNEIIDSSSKTLNKSGFGDLVSENYLLEFDNSQGYYPMAEQKFVPGWKKLWQSIIGNKEQSAELYISENIDHVVSTDNIIYDEEFRQRILNNLLLTSQSLIDNQAKFISPKTYVNTNLQGWGVIQISKDKYYQVDIGKIIDVDSIFSGNQIGLSKSDVGVLMIGLNSGSGKVNYLHNKLNIDLSYQVLQTRLPKQVSQIITKLQSEKNDNEGLVIVAIFYDENGNNNWDLNEKLVPWSGVKVGFSR